MQLRQQQPSTQGNQTENVAYKFTLDNSPPDLFDVLHKEAIFTLSGIYHSQECYHPCLLWLKMFTSSIQTDTGNRHNTRDKKGASNERPQKKKDKSHPSAN
jgi:hypothetical protein